MQSLIRVATKSDAQSVLEIYAPFCLPSSAVSFEIEPPALDDMEGRISKTLPVFPWLVYENAGKVLGYAYASQHKTRAAYDWSADVSVYLHEAARAQGIGKKLYLCLFKIMKELGYFNLYAGVTLPNPASVGLHKSVGFEDLAVYKNVGYKGGWRDVAWFVLALQEHKQDPPAPIKFEEIDQAF